MKKVALTGNIASGKSTVEKIIENSGFKVFDLDIISHNLLEGECRDDILKEFNTIKRDELARIVFSDKKELVKLENIIHPKLKNIILKIFEENDGEKAVFVSGALILEKGFKNLFDTVIFIDANYDIRLKRLIKRNNYDTETAQKRINAQNDSLKNTADFIIENNKDKITLENNILGLLKEII